MYSSLLSFESAEITNPRLIIGVTVIERLDSLNVIALHRYQSLPSARSWLSIYLFYSSEVPKIIQLTLMILFFYEFFLLSKSRIYLHIFASADSRHEAFVRNRPAFLHFSVFYKKNRQLELVINVPH